MSVYSTFSAVIKFASKEMNLIIFQTKNGTIVQNFCYADIPVQDLINLFLTTLTEKFRSN